MGAVNELLTRMILKYQLKICVIFVEGRDSSLLYKIDYNSILKKKLKK